MGEIVTRILSSLQAVDAAAWDRLIADDNPFVTHAFLSALERTGCLRADWGWSADHVTLWQDDRLIAAAPGYRKTNSHGEFVFDHAWARAYAQHGLDYYPKWLGAAPYSPVTGPRLLAADAATRQLLLQTITAHASSNALSSAHINFHTAQDDAHFDATWLPRSDIQYHWQNKQGWQTFDDFLAAMNHKHRKNIRSERRKVQEAGIRFRWLDGHGASADDLRTMHGFYLQTFAEYGNAPALTLEFMLEIARTMPDALLIILAEQQATPIAGAFCLRSASTLYGRYWGANRHLPGLHFETCYYQGIAYCLHHGLQRFEPGAQGEHKIDRGFLPAQVRSRHWIADPRFRQALRAWCEDDTAAVQGYATTLAAHSPFKATTP